MVFELNFGVSFEVEILFKMNAKRLSVLPDEVIAKYYQDYPFIMKIFLFLKFLFYSNSLL